MELKKEECDILEVKGRKEKEVNCVIEKFRWGMWCVFFLNGDDEAKIE